MQLHTIQSRHPMKVSRRIGRGGKRGTTSGRGTKGQKARAGAKIRPAIRDIIKKLPKRRGYHFQPFQRKPIAVDLAMLEEHFSTGAKIDLAALLERGIVHTSGGKIPSVKVLGNSAIKKKFDLVGIATSRAARSRIEAAGGTVR